MSYFYYYSQIGAREVNQLAETFLSEQIKTDVMSTYESILAEGEKRGEKKGLELGMYLKAKEVAITLLEDGFSIEQAARICKLTIEQVKAI